MINSNLIITCIVIITIITSISSITITMFIIVTMFMNNSITIISIDSIAMIIPDRG